jgi:hypothetical protein
MTRLAIAAALLVSCGGSEGGDPRLFGVYVEVLPSAGEYTNAPDFVPRLRLELETIAHYFGHEPEEFSGLHIIIASGPVCGSPTVSGCFDEAANTITVSNICNPLRMENLTLPHEALHYFLRGAPLYGDADHTDQRWKTVLELMKRLGFDMSLCV